MEQLRRRRPADYTEMAYREAVARLKYLLAESYAPVYLSRPERRTTVEKELPCYTEMSSTDPVHLHRLRQEEYIGRLEKEGQVYREELRRMLSPVAVRDTGGRRGALSEGDDSDTDYKKGSRRRGSILYSSRISELEALLTQVRLELRKAQDEAAYLKAHSKPIQPPVNHQTLRQLQDLQRERDELSERVGGLEAQVCQLKEKETSSTLRAKRSLDVVEQAQHEKNQLEMEVRRLKCELERMSDKQREALQESARRVSEAERRYAMQIERLNGDLAAQWDAANRLNLELDRARRNEAELRRELAQKAATIEELKKELMTKTGSLQNEALSATEEREKLEGELAACKLSVERAERQGRTETARLQAEVQALRSRLERTDQDLLHARKENIRLSDVIAGLEKEVTLARLSKDSAVSKDSMRADELTSMIKEMDAKHEDRKSELERLIQSQSRLMEKLNAECQALTKRLEESAVRHKEEMASLQSNIEYLTRKIDAPDHYKNQEWRGEGEVKNNYEEPKSDRPFESNINNRSKEPIQQNNSEKINEKDETRVEEITPQYQEKNETNVESNLEIPEVETVKENVAYPEEQKYKEEASQPVDTSQTGAYDGQEYSMTEPDTYGQVYDQQGGEYETGQGYVEGGEYREGYEGSGAGYEEGGYNQNTEAYQQGYDQGYQQGEYDQGYTGEQYGQEGDYAQYQQEPYGEGDYQGTGEAYQGTGEAYQGTGEAYQGTGEAYQGTGEAYQGTGEAYQGMGEAYQGTGEAYQGTGEAYQQEGYRASPQPDQDQPNQPK